MSSRIFDYLCSLPAMGKQSCGAGSFACGPAFQRVQPPGKAAAARIGCPTRAVAQGVVLPGSQDAA